MIFSEKDLDRISSKGMSTDEVLWQVDLFCRGVKPVKLARSARVGDGIVQVGPDEREVLVSLYNQAARTGRMLKFVPASGAASRMFKDWQARCLQGEFESGEGSVKFSAAFPTLLSMTTSERRFPVAENVLRT